MTASQISTPQLLEENEQLRSSLVHLKLATQKNTAELQAREERFALALRGANDGLWDWNLETNEVYYSSSWKSMLGYEENELEHVFATWETLVHPDDKNRVLATVDLYLKGETDSMDVEFRMFHKQGHIVFVLGRGFSVFSEENKPVRLVGTHVDISKRVKAEIFNQRTASILEMIARGKPAPEIYDAIALMYEERHPGLRCSMLEL